MTRRQSSKKRLTGPHKVALILRMLDEEVSLQILKDLGDRDVARINRADQDLGVVDAVDAAQKGAEEARDKAQELGLKRRQNALAQGLGYLVVRQRGGESGLPGCEQLPYQAAAEAEPDNAE